MPADLAFAISLIVKMAITAGFVLAATLPLGGGPVYVFLAMDHDALFIAQSAVASLANNAVNVIFALVYALLAQRRSLIVSLPGAFMVWLVLTLTIHAIPWNLAGAAVLNVAVLSFCVWLARPLREVPIPRVRPRCYELALRALMVATLVGVTVSLSFRIGPGGSGILAVFPIILISVIIILHRQVGGKPTAAVMANAVLGLVGFAFAAIMLHFTAEPFGSAIGLMLALATAIAWTLLVYGARQRGFRV